MPPLKTVENMLHTSLRLMAWLVLLPLLSLVAATPQESAFLTVWSTHTRNTDDHKAVIEACQRVMDRPATLGEYLPAVKTLAGWHLLADNKQADAIRLFESALVTDKNSPPITQWADTMARRWLTRLDYQKLERALKTYYAEHVAFPASLSPLYALNPPPPKSDRFGDAWVYQLESMSRLTGLANQRYSLASRTLGRGGSRLSSLPFDNYGRRTATLIGRKSASPPTLEIEITTTDGATSRAIVAERAMAGGLRLLKLSSDGQFALLVESESDFWVVAPAAGGRR